jgi:hypothetical protein
MFVTWRSSGELTKVCDNRGKLYKFYLLGLDAEVGDKCCNEFCTRLAEWSLVKSGLGNALVDERSRPKFSKLVLSVI